ncbi:MAG: Ppx/GppA family phosphatase [Acidobacteria bacterium]|nr:Ppx/GppA family phosphatase [Acidobacteriaceae bacterium]MBV9608253.1 Ppx/GppA family phosphatase [Acidobacteriota bacterium]
MATFAAVDIGSNSVRLKIARPVRQRLHVLHEDREVTRLGEGVFRTGFLEPTAIAHTVKVLRRFHRAAQQFGANVVRVVATSALRDARNSSAFVDWVRSATGWQVEIISGLEEGRLIHLGVMSGTRTARSRVLLIDLGGGSCELTMSVSGQIHQMVSLPIGAVRLTQEFLRRDPPKKKEVERLQEFVSEEVSRVERRIAAARPQMVIATSGTAAALASLVAARKKRRVSGVVAAAVVHELARELPRRTLAERIAMPGIGPRRAEIIIAGVMVFDELMARGLSSFRYSPLGLRDGLLAQMVAEHGGTQIQKQIESERWNALLSTVRHYGVDSRFARQVREMVQRLFTGLKRLHDLPPEYEQWLVAAAMLHEVGNYINRAGRHRHAYYIISNSEIFGYTIAQRLVIAAIARYMGKSRPSAADRALKPLSLEEREHVPKAVALLRIARALDQGRRGAVTAVTPQLRDGDVVLKLTTKRGGASLEMWALEKERDYFKSVFGRELVGVAS